MNDNHRTDDQSSGGNTTSLKAWQAPHCWSIPLKHTRDGGTPDTFEDSIRTLQPS